MRLYTHELKTELTQKITPTKNILLEAIRPHILKYGNPAGSLVVSVTDEDGFLANTGETILISDISTANYFHGMVRFYVSYPMKEGVTYTIKLSSVGYTFASNAWVGWVNAHGLEVVATDYVGNEYQAPLHLELWEKRNIARG